MNDQRIQELTRRYLQSLDLSNPINRNQRGKIIEINNQSEWLIFNASSLVAKRLITSGYDFFLWTDQNGLLFQGDGSLSNVHIETFISKKWRELGLKSNSYQLKKEQDRWKVMSTLVGQDKPTHLIFILDEINQISADKEITGFLRKYQQSTNSEEKEKIRQKIQKFVIKSVKNKFLNFAYQKKKNNR